MLVDGNLSVGGKLFVQGIDVSGTIFTQTQNISEILGATPKFDATDVCASRWGQAQV